MSDVARIQRRLEREKIARKSAEEIAEEKTRQLYKTNQDLSQLSENIEKHSVELQETLGYLTAIIDNMADGLLVVDSDDQIRLVNNSFLQMFCLKRQDIENQNSRAVLGKHLLELIVRSKSVTQGENIRLDIEMPDNKTGRAVSSPIYSKTLADGGETKQIGVVTIIRDFTAEKEIDRMKTEFISNVSHELRTPLTSILGFTKIIKKRLDGILLPALDANQNPKIGKAVSQVTGNIEIIISEGERLSNLINEVLDVAKIEAGKVDWHMVPISASSIIERAAAATRSLFEGDNVTFRLEIEDGLPEINADQDRIIQVLVNLISNASKFTENGSVICKAVRSDKDIVISLIDTGIGIAKDSLAQVFDKFKQVGETLTDKPKGTGLGLPICKQIVEHHGGRIWVESVIGQGSTFSFSIPFIEPSISELQPDRTRDLNALLSQLRDEDDVGASPSEKRKKTVLVVDDEPTIREYLRQELEAEGYDVQEAENGLEAISKAKELLPDLVLLDVMMPIMNGFDAAAVLKNDPQTMKIPIVILSIIEDLDRGYRIGISRYLKKPIEADVLLNEVASLVSREGTKKKVLFVNQDPLAIRTLTQTLQSKGDTIVEVCDGKNCIVRAMLTQPDTIIFDTSISGYHEIEKALRKEKGLESVSFILLGEGQDLKSSDSASET